MLVQMVLLKMIKKSTEGSDPDLSQYMAQYNSQVPNVKSIPSANVRPVIFEGTVNGTVEPRASLSIDKIISYEGGGVGNNNNNKQQQ